MPGHIRLYYCWKAVKMLTAFGMPTSPGERDEFITNLLGADYETIWPGVEVELLHMINVTIEAFAERYVAEAGPKKRARFEVGHWAWHLREGVPVIIIKWGKTFCRIAVPIRQLAAPVCPPDSAHMVTGWLSQYSEAPTVATIAYRQSVGDLPLDLSLFDGFVAVADCDRIGDTGWLSIAGGALERVAVFDCAGPDGTVTWMRENKIIAEVDYYTAERYQLDGGAEALLFWDEQE